jgi:hypothetical protein
MDSAKLGQALNEAVDDWTHPVIGHEWMNLAIGAYDAEKWPHGYSPVPPPDAAKRKRLIEGDSAHRKHYPMCTGLLDYAPDALAEIANVSFLGNEKHNPGEPMHHARGKSMDHADCMMRHLAERGGYDVIVVNGVEHKVRHSAALAWRAIMHLQEELEAEFGFALPRGAKDGGS